MPVAVPFLFRGVLGRECGMALVYRSGPAVEPLSLADAKAHLRLETSADDALVTSLIITSRLHIEAALGLALTAQDWTLVLDAWPATGVVTIPMRPVSAVTAVRVRAADGSASVVPPERYLFEGAGLPPRLVPVSDALPSPGRAAGGIEIDFTAGFGTAAASVPEPKRTISCTAPSAIYSAVDQTVDFGTPQTAVSVRVRQMGSNGRRGSARAAIL